jgi:uncharacterized membrane protein YcaP (DUF421 family)
MVELLSSPETLCYHTGAFYTGLKSQEGKMQEIGDVLEGLLGFGAEDINWYQMGLRALIIYLASLLMVRIGEKRFLGKNTAFDVILGIILGSVVSRAINGSAPFFPTILAGFVLVGLHWLFAALSFRWEEVSGIIKGSDRKIVEDGEILWDSMRKSHIGKNDLLSAVRINAQTEDLQAVKAAYVERSGDISIIKASSGPKILNIDVQEGVQTIRIKLE